MYYIVAVMLVLCMNDKYFMLESLRVFMFYTNITVYYDEE